MTPPPPPLTKTQLDEMEWAEFERCVVDLIQQIYGHVVDIRQTGHNDDGRDGEGTFTLPLPEPFSLKINVWVEVKQRSRGSLGAKDYGTTTFRAVLEPVHKLILATNRTLSAPYKEQLSTFGEKLRMDITILEQQDIIALSNMPPSQRSGMTADDDAKDGCAAPHVLTISATLLSNPAGPVQKSEIDPDRLAYIAVDVRTDKAGVIYGYDLDVKFDTPLHLGNSVKPLRDVLIGPGFRRHLFPFLPEAGSEFSLASIARLAATVDSGHSPSAHPVEMDSSVMSVLRRPLCDTPLPYQERVIQCIEAQLDSAKTRPAFFLIQAGAGAGKSHLVQKLRTDCERRGVSVLWLDGEETKTPAAVFRTIVKACFANTYALLDPGCEVRFRSWLEENGFRARQALLLAQSILEEGKVGQCQALFSELYLDTAALLLDKVARRRPLAFFFEDLHKVSPTTIDMLRGLLPRMAGLGRGIAVVMTTRPTDIRFGDEAEAEMDSGLLVPLNSAKQLQKIRLEPDEREKIEGARLLLKAALPGLPEWQLSSASSSGGLAASIIDQVGTTPFNIKEALLFLEGKKLIAARRAGDGVYDIVDYDVMLRRIRHDGLAEVTETRISGFITDSTDPAQIFNFLASGALLGRIFDQSLCLRGTSLLPEVRNRLLYWDIVRQGDEPTKFQFSHDLVRMAVLQVAHKQEATTRTEVAPALYQALDDGAPASDADQEFLKARVACVAKLGRKAAEHLDEAADLFASQRRHLDAAFARLSLGELCSVGFGNISQLSSGLPDFLARDPVLEVFPPSGGPPLELANRFDLLLEAAEDFLAGGLGEAAGLGPLVDEICMAAKRLGPQAEAKAEYLLGRLHFARDQFTQAAIHHGLALAHVRVHPLTSDFIPESDLKHVKQNVDRLYLCARQLGRDVDVRRLLRFYNRVLEKAGASHLARWTWLANRIGYAQLYKSPDATTRLWRKQLRLARQEACLCSADERPEVEERVISALIGTATMEFATGKGESGTTPKQRLQEAEEILQRIQRRNLQIRVYMMLANIELAAGRPVEARSYAAEAELLASALGNQRRLWRVLAVRACVEEACLAVKSSGEVSVTPQFLDEQVMKLVGHRVQAEAANLSDGIAPWMVQRHVLGVINAAIRSPDLVASLPADAAKRILETAEAVRRGDLSLVPPHLRIFFKSIQGVGIRAMVTE